MNKNDKKNFFADKEDSMYDNKGRQLTSLEPLSDNKENTINKKISNKRFGSEAPVRTRLTSLDRVKVKIMGHRKNAKSSIDLRALEKEDQPPIDSEPEHHSDGEEENFRVKRSISVHLTSFFGDRPEEDEINKQRNRQQK